MAFSSKNNLIAAGFPPNLEDGELWLPSDIIHEITYSTDLPPQKNLSFSPPPPPSTTLSPVLPSNGFRVHSGFMGVNTNENYVTSDGYFYSDHHNGCATLFNGFQQTHPPSISSYYIPIKQHVTQGLKEKGGTGVFIPRAVFAKREEMSNCGGARILLNNQRKIKSGDNSEGAFKSRNVKKSTMQEEGLTKKDKSQSQHPVKKILPKDCTY